MLKQRDLEIMGSDHNTGKFQGEHSDGNLKREKN